MKKIFLCALIAFFLYFTAGSAFAENKYPDFAEIYLGKDKFENFNRKMFKFNGALNKFAIHPAAVVWSSIMPKYGIERLKLAYDNILYPRRLVSTLLQRDFKGALKTSARFITNSTVGLGGMYDPAKKFLKLKPVNEDMEQALAKLKVKQGPYLVVPVLASTTPRGLLGKAFDSALDPTSYIGSYIIAGIKAGFTLNNAALMQPLIRTLSLNYIDPYEITKKLYGLQTAILDSNLDRDEVISNRRNEEEILEDLANEMNILNISDEISNETIKGSATADEILFNDDLIPDIILKDFNPQDPVTDSMRTALFDLKGIDESFWGEDSLWNRSFKNRIKTDEIEIYENREKYKFRYILQKDKNSPLAIIYPSVGEGINSHHSVVFAKLFYDAGYSVLIQGSAFHYDFIKSMPESYKPGIPSIDVKYLQETTGKIIDTIQNKQNCNFKDKVVLGTSYGALSSLFLADLEAKENNLNISKFISINPPVELMYAMNVIDSNSEEWNQNKENIKEKTTLTAAKIIQTANKRGENEKIETLPFNQKESKLITGFVLHQKLSDLLFAIENISETKKTDFYEKIKNINYKDYAMKYLLTKGKELEGFEYEASLYSIKNYLAKNNNYLIYHSLDDYLTNTSQLKKLKEISKSKMRLIDKGAHLGFLYREEFIDDLKKEISLKNKEL